MDLTTLILSALKASIMLNVLAFGLKASPEDILYMVRHPRELARAFTSMYVVMPALAIALCMAFDIKAPVKIALIALSISPIPPLFPKKALKKGGEADYTIGLLVAAGVLSIAVIPIMMKVVSGLAGIPLEMPAAAVAKLVLLTTLVPLVVGIVVRRFAPAAAEWAAKPLGILAMLLLIGTALPVLAKPFQHIQALIGDGTLLAVVAFALVGLVTGRWFGKPQPENSRVLSFATASRHPGIAAAIAQTNFPDEKLILPAILLYMIVSGILCAVAPRLTRD